MVMGEESGSFGRMIMRGVAEGVLTFAAIATAVRGVEAVLAARTALQRGVAPDDVADALAPPPEASQERVGTLKTTVMLAGASALALAQARVDLLGLPGPLEFLGNVITVLTPPVIIQRALASARRESSMGALSYAFVRKPLARRVVGWLGGGCAAPARSRARRGAGAPWRCHCRSREHPSRPAAARSQPHAPRPAHAGARGRA